MTHRARSERIEARSEETIRREEQDVQAEKTVREDGIAAAQTERTETVSVLIGWTGMRAGSRVACVVIDDEPMTLKIPKGTRGVKVGSKLVVRVEYRDWFAMTRTTVSLLNGTSETIEDRRKYNDGELHAHPHVVGVER